MLGSHDGIPLLDLKGLLDEEQIQSLIDTIVIRGGLVKDLHGQKNVYYQVNATYFSALGEDERKLLLARAIQLFMPGKPQIWYLDLFAGKNDYEAVSKAGAGGHKEINRTNLSLKQAEEDLKQDIVKNQLKLLKFRNSFPAFGFDSRLEVTADEGRLLFQWKRTIIKHSLSRI
jgi:sucrose phosphorylase